MYYEATKERYVFNLPQIQPSLTRNVQCVNETRQYITRNTMEF